MVTFHWYNLCDNRLPGVQILPMRQCPMSDVAWGIAPLYMRVRYPPHLATGREQGRIGKERVGT